MIFVMVYGTTLFPDFFLKALFIPRQTCDGWVSAPDLQEGNLSYFISNYCNLQCSIEAKMSNSEPHSGFS